LEAPKLVRGAVVRRAPRAGSQSSELLEKTFPGEDCGQQTEKKNHAFYQGKLEPGNTGIAFYSQDVEKTAAEMKKKGVKFSMNVAKRSPSTIVMFEDPDGEIFLLRQREP